MKKSLGLLVLSLALVGVSLYGMNTALAAGHTVDWNLYPGGQLVINGDNPEYGEPKYSGTIDVDNKPSYSYDSAFGHVSIRGVPWGPQDSKYDKTYLVKEVEFAYSDPPLNPRYMDYWFYECTNLTKFDSTNLDTSNTVSFNNMFYKCTSLTDISSLSIWANNLDSAEDFSQMFYYCEKLEDLRGLSNWKFPKVTDMSYMFYMCKILKDISPLTDWDVSNVANLSHMLSSTAINDVTPLADWKFDNAESLAGMINLTPISDLTPLQNWTFPKTKDLGGLFNSLNIKDLTPIAGWTFPEVTSMDYFFSYATIPDLTPIADWEFPEVTDMQNMFMSCKMTDLTPIGNWKFPKVTDMSQMFRSTNFTNLNGIENWTFPEVTDMSGMFKEMWYLNDLSAISSWEFPKVRDISEMFQDCSKIEYITLSDWDVTGIRNFRNLFNECYNVKEIDISGWFVADANVDGMFNFNNVYGSGNKVLTTIWCVNSWNVQSDNVVFNGCSKLYSASSGKKYSSSQQKINMANPYTGYFTLPQSEDSTPATKTYVPWIQKQVKDAEGNVVDWDFKNNPFTFEISSDDPTAPIPEPATAQTDASGYVVWNSVELEGPKEYKYKVEEIEGDNPYMAYDSSTRELTAVVE